MSRVTITVAVSLADNATVTVVPDIVTVLTKAVPVIAVTLYPSITEPVVAVPVPDVAVEIETVTCSYEQVCCKPRIS